jgi:hypothetical protein
LLARAATHLAGAKPGAETEGANALVGLLGDGVKDWGQSGSFLLAIVKVGLKHSEKHVSSRAISPRPKSHQIRTPKINPQSVKWVCIIWRKRAQALRGKRRLGLVLHSCKPEGYYLNPCATLSNQGLPS